MKLPRQKITVNQYHYHAAPADAVTNHMLFVQRALREIGIGGKIFADQIKPGTSPLVHLLSTVEIWNCDCLLLHHSQANLRLKELLNIEVPKALVYHNITPTQFFTHDAHLAYLNQTGITQLQRIKNSIVESFTVSKFNSQALEQQGYAPSQIIPLYDFDALLRGVKTKTNHPPPAKGLTFLFVGRLVPHKNPALLINMFHYYLTRVDPRAQLVLAGKADPIYGAYLQMLVSALGINTNVNFTGQISQRALFDLYRQCDVFVCASEHEGYGIPLVEAMKAGLGVFAVDSTGVNETLGTAGVKWATRRPGEMAETISSFVSSRSLWQSLIASQTGRLAEIKQNQTTLAMQRAILSLIHRLRKTPIEGLSRKHVRINQRNSDLCRETLF
jgi:glycosyltransferase involved in cell wall biosynthesis